MKITIEKTDLIVEFNGVKYNLWEGTTGSGIRVYCVVPQLAINKNEIMIEQFKHEMKQMKKPSPEAANTFLKLIVN